MRTSRLLPSLLQSVPHIAQIHLRAPAAPRSLAPSVSVPSHVAAVVVVCCSSYFREFVDSHFARSGCIATSDFSLDAGPLPVDIAPHPLEPTLRKLGLPTRLNASVVELMHDTLVCSAGDVLTPEQCRLLQLFDQRQAAFRIHVIAALNYTADEQSDEGRLEVIREAATTRVDQAAVTGSASRQSRRRGAAAMADQLAGMEADGGAEVQVFGEDEGEEDEEEDEDDGEFVPEPFKGWGEVAVPTYT